MSSNRSQISLHQFQRLFALNDRGLLELLEHGLIPCVIASSGAIKVEIERFNPEDIERVLNKPPQLEHDWKEELEFEQQLTDLLDKKFAELMERVARRLSTHADSTETTSD